jgi:metallophosphoesterase (TIGR03768 family)
MKKEVTIGILIVFFIIALSAGYLIFFNTSTSGTGEPSYPIESRVYTTLYRTVIPVPVPSASPALYPYQVANYSEYGYGIWQYGGGLDYQKRLDLMPPAYANTSVTSKTHLLHFFTMSDIHLSDKETPAQGIYAGYKGGNPSAYSVQMLTTTQVLDAAVQTVNALHQQKPFDFGMFLGDAINSNQYNELRWYIDVLDGKTINPDSGAKDDPIPGILNDYQDKYKAAGLNTTIRWYQTLGNHDQFWMGSYPSNNYLKKTVTGDYILNVENVSVDPTASFGVNGLYLGSIDGRTQYGDIIGAGPAKDFAEPPKVPASDPDRRYLSTEEWLGEFFTTSTSPKGHGFNLTDASSGFACYSFEPRSDIPLKVIVLDDTRHDTDPVVGNYAYASLDNKRYNWLVGELESGQVEGKLMIIAAHIPIRNEPPGSSNLWSSDSPVSEQTLIARLHTYPNLLLWMSGHTHENTVTSMPSTDPAHPELGFWEVETASLRDFPQQFRTFDIVLNSDNTVSIFTTDVDPAVRNGSLAGMSRSYAIASHEIFNNSVTELPTGSYNAELVKQLTPEMQARIQNYGNLIGA